MIKAPGPEGSKLSETFLLGGGDGVMMRCPSPGFSIKLLQLAITPEGPGDEPNGIAASNEQRSSCAYAPANPQQRPGSMLLLLTIASLALVRRRPRRCRR